MMARWWRHHLRPPGSSRQQASKYLNLPFPKCHRPNHPSQFRKVCRSLAGSVFSESSLEGWYQWNCQGSQASYSALAEHFAPPAMRGKARLCTPKMLGTKTGPLKRQLVWITRVPYWFLQEIFHRDAGWPSLAAMAGSQPFHWITGVSYISNNWFFDWKWPILEDLRFRHLGTDPLFLWRTSSPRGPAALTFSSPSSTWSNALGFNHQGPGSIAWHQKEHLKPV